MHILCKSACTGEKRWFSNLLHNPLNPYPNEQHAAKSKFTLSQMRPSDIYEVTEKNDNKYVDLDNKQQSMKNISETKPFTN